MPGPESVVGPLQAVPRPQPRRDALLRAAVDVIGQRGLAGATHKAVTERANVPLATASYYFSSIAELLREALEVFIAERAEDLDTMGDQPLQELTPGSIAGWFADQLMELPQTRALAFYEVLINAARAPELMGPVAGIVARFQDTAESGLEAGGAQRPAEGARPLLALSLGFGLLHLAQPRAGDIEEYEEALTALWLAYTLNDDEWQQWRTRMGPR
jgi:AcrR family transcriptional regulator